MRLIRFVDEGISQLRGPGIRWMQSVWIQRLDVRRCWMSQGNQGIWGEGDELLLMGVECGICNIIYLYVYIYIHADSLSIFCIRFFDYSILFHRWDDIFSWFWNACFFWKCLVMYSFYACNLPKDSWNILGIYLSNWQPTDLALRKKLQMLGISLKRHEHRNQASPLKGGEAVER